MTGPRLYSHIPTSMRPSPSLLSRDKQLDSMCSQPQPTYRESSCRCTQSIVQHHHSSTSAQPLRMVVSGTAGTGKSYLIHCLRLLRQHQVMVAAPTGVAAFNIDGCTLHSLLRLPTRGEFKDLEGERLTKLQQAFSQVKYLKSR